MRAIAFIYYKENVVLRRQTMKHFLYPILLFLGLTIHAQSPSLNVGGTISQEDKTALADAKVEVKRDGKAFTTFQTSASGSYYLFLEMGSIYEVSVSKKGFMTKFFTISTLGVKEVKERKRFSVMIADLELIEYYPGVDFSALNQPMNKYYYNPQTDDFEYDADYLKDMLEELKQIKADKKQAIKLAKQKSDKEKKDAISTKEKKMAEERLAVEASNLKAMEEELKANKRPTVDPGPAYSSQKILQADQIILNTNGKDREGLMAKYPNGVTEEVINAAHVTVIQRILVVKDQNAWVYHKKIFDWGGVAFFRDGEPITEMIFEAETKKKI
jgi:hypothetical protein